MAGHSKWKNIKHKKASADKVKMKKFTKLSREITIAAKGNPDSLKNPTLRNLLEKANSINMSKENCLRAIKKAQDHSSGLDYQSFLYEGYAPHNVGIIVDVLCDNKNKAAAEIRSLFNKNGGRISPQGSVSWMFERVFIIEAEASDTIDEEALLSTLLEYALIDVEVVDASCTIFCLQEESLAIKEALIGDLGFFIKEDYLGYMAKEKMELASPKEYEEVAAFVSILEESDDVQNVFVTI
jgi:YebC/PmpR family DNA-binding regulatory protein